MMAEHCHKKNVVTLRDAKQSDKGTNINAENHILKVTIVHVNTTKPQLKGISFCWSIP